MAPSTTTACAAALLLLTACSGSGGGGDGGGESCPTGSTIGIFPTKLRVTAGAGPTEFGGGVANCTVDSKWSLVGPGSLDKTSGVPVHYTPPASVDAMVTATLTITVADLSASATITIDPSVMALHGRVLTADGRPVARAQVKVGTATATSGTDGSFALPGVAPPYDIYVTSEDGLLTSVYPGLHRQDPTLTLFDGTPNYLPTTWYPTFGTNGGYVSGAISGGAGFPSDHVSAVAFHSPESAASFAVDDTTGAFTLQGIWDGSSTTTGVLHALQWSVDGNGFPVNFDGHAVRSGVTITAGQSLPGQDLALSPVANAAIVCGTSDGNGTNIAARVVFPDGTWLRFFPPLDANSYVGGGAASYTIPTPAIAGVTIDLLARRNYAGWGYQEIHLHGLAPNAANATFSIGGLPQPESPPSGAANVGAGTLFRWYTMPDNPVYVISFRPDTGAPARSPSYDVFLTGNGFVVPDGIPLPKSAPYTWRVRGSSAFATVEDAAGPKGFLATAPSYRIAQGTPNTFTTAP